MIDVKYAISVAFLGATLSTADMAVAQEQPWCAVDDPAVWRIERRALARDGKRDESLIKCNAKQSGQTLPEALTLPMPCGRAMVFRRIDVPLTHPMDQVAGNFGRVVDISRESPIKVLSNGAWTAPVSGSFTLGTESSGLTSSFGSFSGKAYYIAKYELTEAQWLLFDIGALEPELAADALTEICDKHDAWMEDFNPKHVLAKAGLSWFDVIAFSRAYSNWLIARDRQRIADGAQPDLPWEQGATGYVRPPTEAEWEFAARGGADGVTPQAQAKAIPLAINEQSGTLEAVDLAEICADEPDRDRGIVGGVGRKRPNAFFLYDMLCNAEEIVLDLFRPTRPDGLHGQVGGITAKGGSSASLRSENTVGRRREAQALFTMRGEGRPSAAGARMAISAPIFPGSRVDPGEYVEGRGNAMMLEALMSGRQALLDTGLNRGGTAALTREIDDLRKKLDDGQSSTEQLSQQVARLSVTVDQLSTELTDQATVSVRTAIRGAVTTSIMIDRVGANLLSAYARLEEFGEKERRKELTKAETDKYRGIIRPGIDRNKKRIAAGFDLYLQFLRQIADEEDAFVTEQMAAAKAGVSGANVVVFGKYLDLFEIHYSEMLRQRGRITETMRDEWLGELDSFKDRRIEKYAKYEL